MGMPKDESPGTPEWIVTFTDLMSLLLCFFVLLLTFSTPKVEKLFELRGSIQYAFGIFSGPMDDRDTWLPPNPNRQGRDQYNPYAPALMPRFRPLEDHDPNRSISRLRGKDDEAQIDWDKLKSGYQVRIGEAIAYAPGERDMSADSFSKLDKIYRTVEHVPYDFVIIGYVGEEELSILQNRGDDPMEVATDRALRVALRLVERYGLKTENLAIAAYGPEANGDPNGKVEFLLANNTEFLDGG